MKVLVTGSAGFIGSHLCLQFLKQGHQVVGIDFFDDLYNPEIKRITNSHLESFENFVFLNLDLNDFEKWTKLIYVKDFDVIFHFAAFAGVRRSIQEPISYIKNNILSTVYLLEWAKIKPSIKIAIASSSSVYGNQDKGPFKEDSFDTNHPISPYASTKRSIEIIGYNYCHLYNMNVTFLRFFTVYGPNGRLDMAPLRFLIQCYYDIPITLYGDGSFQRDFTFVSDIVNGIIKASEHANGYHIYNLGCGEPHTIMELIENIEKSIHKKIKINFKPEQPGDVGLTYADTTKAQTELNFKPMISLKEGIEIMAQWFLNLSDEHKKLLLNEIKK